VEFLRYTHALSEPLFEAEIQGFGQLVEAQAIEAEDCSTLRRRKLGETTICARDGKPP